MSILQIQEIASNNDRIKVQVKSMIDKWEDTIVVYKSNLHHRTNVIRATRMKIYITRFLKSRMKAYEAKGGTNDPRYQSIKDLHHHISTSNKRWDDFMAWMVRRESTLLVALPKEENASHEKINNILALCKELTNT